MLHVGDRLETSSTRDVKNQLNKNIQLFITLFDNSVTDLQEQINKLLKITDDVEKLHRSTTIGSLSGGVIGAAGGITSIVGLILMPFTFGTSLIVAGIGAGVGFLGGVTGASSNIVSMIHQKINREKIDDIIKTLKDKTNCLIKALENVQDSIEEIKALDDQLSTADFSQTGTIGAKSLTGVSELVRIGLITNFARVSAHITKTVNVAASVTGVLAGLSLTLDIVFIVKDTKELREINQQRAFRGQIQQPNQIRSDTLKFINTMRKTVQVFQDTLDKLKQAKDVIENELFREVF